MDTKNIENFILIFTSILWEALPFIVLGAIVAGILEELVPQQLVSKVIPRSRFLAIAIGGLLGILFPMCECGIIPVMRRLLRKGVPLSCCVAYLLAGPIINVVVGLSTYVAFSGGQLDPKTGKPLPGVIGPWGMVALRMGFGYLVAMGTSLIVEWQYRKHGSKLLAPLAVADTSKALAGKEDDDENAPKKSWWEKLSNISETARHDFVDITVFLILGALLAALARQGLHSRLQTISQEQPVVAILLMMGFAIVLCLCSEADAFVAASLTPVKPAAKIAFLVLGPMLDFKLYMMYTRVFRPRLIWTIIISVVVQVFLYSVLLHYIHEGWWPEIEARLRSWSFLR